MFEIPRRRAKLPITASARARSSGVGAEVVKAACGPGIGVSDAMSLASKYASFDMSKFGALPLSTVARTASANCVSGRSHEP
jgi:hypothetical protein